MSPPLPQVVKKNSKHYVECVNCSVSVVGGNSDEKTLTTGISAFIIRENEKDVTINVTEALVEVYKVESKSRALNQQLVLCLGCSAIFPQMYKLYRDFSHRSTDKSFLYRRKEKVEEVLEKWYSTTEPEPELEQAVTAQDLKPILQAGPILEEECELPVPLEAPVDEMDPLAIKEENPCGPGNNDIPGNSNKSTTSTSIRNSFFKGKKPKLEKWESHPSPKTEVVVPSLPTKDTESEFSCPKCRRNFQTAFQLSCHQVYCGTPSDLEKLVSNRFQCKVCNAYFNTEDAWQNHNQSQHFGKRPFIDCLYCPAKLPSLKVLQKHMRLHSQITDPKKISSAEEISTPNNEAAPVTQAAIPLGAPNIIVQSYLQKYLGDGKRKHGGHQKILK